MDSIIWILPLIIAVILFTSKKHTYSFMVPQNTSQDEIKKRARRIFLITRLPIPFGMLVVVGALEFFVVPKLRDVYLQFGGSEPPIAAFLPYIIAITIAVSFVIVLRTIDQPQYVSTPTEDGKIKVTPHFSAKQEELLLILLGLLVGIIVYTYMTPIYSLIWKF